MGTPCKDCILIAICRNKFFSDLKRDCSLLEKFLGATAEGSARGGRGYYYRIGKVIKDLNPTKFSVRITANQSWLRQDLKPKKRKVKYGSSGLNPPM
jgi:hypothetical protein